MSAVKKNKYPKNKAREKTRDKKSAFKRENEIDRMLVPGEEVVAQAEVHNGIYWQTIAVLIFAVIVLLFVKELGILLLVTAVIMAIYATLRKSILMLVLTNKRIMFRYGILQVDVVDLRFSKVESIELERMMPGYIMGYSNAVVMGTGQRYVVIPYVANGPELRQAYNKMTLMDDDPNEDE